MALQSNRANSSTFHSTSKTVVRLMIASIVLKYLLLCWRVMNRHVLMTIFCEENNFDIYPEEVVHMPLASYMSRNSRAMHFTTFYLASYFNGMQMNV